MLTTRGVRYISTWAAIILFVLLISVGCKGHSTPTSVPTVSTARSTPAMPTRAPAVTPPAGLPPATSLLPQTAWLTVHVEAADGARWTAVAYGDRDEIYDESTHRHWVDTGAFLSRHRHVWEALLRQAAFLDMNRDAYLTDCPDCPRVALAVRFEQENVTKGLWTQVRPYDAPLPIFRLLPVENALRLTVESIMEYPASTLQSGIPPQPASAPPDILHLLYGDALQQGKEGLVLGDNVHPWVLDVVEGSFTEPAAREIVALVGGTVPEEEYTDADRPYVMARLLVLRQKEDDTWTIVGQSDPLASNVTADEFPAVIDQVIDFDHDGRQEILFSVASLLPGYLDGIYHLYRWNGEKLQRVWMTTFMYDNVSLSDQPDYATQIAWPAWTDQDGDGVDEIVLTVHRRTYARVPPGIPDTSQIKSQTTSETLFRWDGRGFQLVGP